MEDTMSPALLYEVHLHNLHAHLYRVTVHIAQPQAQQTVSLPVWIPGSYLVREFSKNLQNLQAHQNGQACTVTASSKQQWHIDCSDQDTLTLSYEVNAYDNSVRMAWLDAERGFFNGTSVLLRVHGQEQQRTYLHIHPHADRPDWQLATGLEAIAIDPQGFGRYTAENYDMLVDAPVEIGAFWSGSFSACGIEHRFVVAGAPASFDGQRLLADSQKICEAQIRFWHPEGQPPHSRYVFMLNATHDGYGGLEHSNSTALICSRADLPRLGCTQQAEGYNQLLGLISHEYFHTWNVKRLRPAELTPYNYNQENYTTLLWFFEGLTSYYDDLFLHRTGLISTEAYLKLLGKTLQQVLQTPGRHIHSVAQASFDAWVKYYRQDENTANITVSYYTKGALVGLCLDLSLRRAGSSLDALMRALWRHCQGGALQEADILTCLHSLTGRSWQPEIQAWVHGTQDLPLAELLATFGITLTPERAGPTQALGLRVQEGSSITVRQVLRGGIAEQAGMMAGDEWYGLEVSHPHAADVTQVQAWRIGKLDELALYVGPATQVTALVARDRRLLRLQLQLPPLIGHGTQVSNVQLRTSDNTLLTGWLQSAAA